MFRLYFNNKLRIKCDLKTFDFVFLENEYDPNYEKKSKNLRRSGRAAARDANPMG
jgi:hypothetical protein